LTLSIQDLARGLCDEPSLHVDRLEFAQQLLLALGQIDRRLDHDVAHQVAVVVELRTPLMPLPRRRNTLPLWVSAGILIFAVPSSVGISISPPSAAW
jgi:hypothetical protein